MGTNLFDRFELGEDYVGVEAVFAGLQAGIDLQVGGEGVGWLGFDKLGFDGFGMLKAVDCLDARKIGNGE